MVTSALEQPHGAVVGVGDHDHAVAGRGGDGLAAGGHAARHAAPCPVLAADVAVAIRLRFDRMNDNISHIIIQHDHK